MQLPEVERDVRWPELRRIAARAEEAGFDSLWVGDHMLYRGDGRPERGPWDAWTLLAALAGATGRVTLGPLVAATAFHPPGLVARMAATIDEIAGGRFVLGLGAGWNETEFRAFGIPFDRRVARFEEAFEIVRRLLAGERVSFEGRFHRLEDAVLLPRPRRPVPLLVGSRGPRILAASLPHVAAWNAWYDWYGNDAEGFAALSGSLAGSFRRSACVLVAVDGGAGERVHEAEPLDGSPEAVAAELRALVAVDGGAGERPRDEDAPPVEARRLAAHLRELADAGADEAILVLDPITERSVAAVADAL